MKSKNYDRQKAIQYARKWAMDRNPKYYNFDTVGGDCTSFVSQVIYEGSRTMNYDLNGWYYRNGNDKSPSWSGVEYLYKFIVNNKSIGPFGREVGINEIEKGDIIQLSFDKKRFQHSLVIVDIINNLKDFNHILIASHTEDSINRKLSTYTFYRLRFLKIDGVRYY